MSPRYCGVNTHGMLAAVPGVLCTANAAFAWILTLDTRVELECKKVLVEREDLRRASGGILNRLLYIGLDWDELG
jgi:hypothetical protein